MDASSNSSNTSASNVSFGTVTLREYEREIDKQADVDLGLTIGWKFHEHSPMDVNEFSPAYREIEPTSEGERASILLENGFSKRQLRSAIRQRHRHLDRDDDVSLPKAVISVPTLVMQKISKGFKWFGT
jgi:hypothetical protein